MKPADVDLGDEVSMDVPSQSDAGLVIAVRVTPNDVEMLLGTSEERGVTVSQVVGDALHQYLRHRAEILSKEPVTNRR